MNTYIKIVKNKKIKNIQLTKKSKTLYNDIDIEICQSTRTNQTASIQPKPPEGCRKASIFVVLRGFLIKLIERYPSFTHQFDGLYKFNIVYSEDFSLNSFSNVSKNFGTFARSFLNI